MKKFHLSTRTSSILKYCFAFTLLGYVLNKVGIEQIGSHMKEISVAEGLGALALVLFAQYFAAMRMRYFFEAAMFKMHKKFAVVLFFVGAFYNFLLPGGIGGDAYKVILVRRRMEIPALQGIRIMIADRASGLCIVLMTMYLCLYLQGFTQLVPYGGAMLLFATVITPAAYLFFSKLLLKQLPIDMVGALRYSLVSQLFWMGSLALLWKGISHSENLIAYITLYCASSVASLIPFSVGGLGLREMAFYYGAQLMQDHMGVQVNPDLGIAISLCLFAVTFVSALPGLFWLNKVSKADVA